MGTDDREQERLRQLRQRQLADRDPLVKQRQFQRRHADLERRSRKPVTLSGMWGDIPHIWRGFLFGALLGVITMAVVPVFWTSSWAFYCSAASAVIFILFGVVVGRALDSRDDINDLTR